MPRGRQTEDPKPNVIRIRLNEDMRQWVEKKSITEGKSISQIIRDAVNSAMSKSE